MHRRRRTIEALGPREPEPPLGFGRDHARKERPARVPLGDRLGPRNCIAVLRLVDWATIKRVALPPLRRGVELAAGGQAYFRRLRERAARGPVDVARQLPPPDRRGRVDKRLAGDPLLPLGELQGPLRLDPPGDKIRLQARRVLRVGAQLDAQRGGGELFRALRRLGGVVGVRHRESREIRARVVRPAASRSLVRPAARGARCPTRAWGS
mmetsp:Transcript_2718/g.8167  ORF Transcript_2718/g.8167 Transcript_2718/m.8167 type:complete len:210 (+) Transcript_2718:600-1229(+)